MEEARLRAVFEDADPPGVLGLAAMWFGTMSSKRTEFRCLQLGVQRIEVVVGAELRIERPASTTS